MSRFVEGISGVVVIASFAVVGWVMSSPSPDEVERGLNEIAARYAHEVCLEGGTDKETDALVKKFTGDSPKELAEMLEEMTGEKECSTITFKERFPE